MSGSVCVISSIANAESSDLEYGGPCQEEIALALICGLQQKKVQWKHEPDVVYL